MDNKSHSTGQCANVLPMKTLCVVCGLWLVEPMLAGGEVSYWCERCFQEELRQNPEIEPIDKWRATRLSENKDKKMANYGYYLPLAPNLFESVRFLGIDAKTEGFGEAEVQKKDKDGTPIWVISALVKYQGANQEAENFTLAAPLELMRKIGEIEELTPIRLVGLSGGKWSRANSDNTTWSFQISGIEVIKA